jgi:hypothetical protein
MPPLKRPRRHGAAPCDYRFFDRLGLGSQRRGPHQRCERLDAPRIQLLYNCRSWKKVPRPIFLDTETAQVLNQWKETRPRRLQRRGLPYDDPPPGRILLRGLMSAIRARLLTTAHPPKDGWAIRLGCGRHWSKKEAA